MMMISKRFVRLCLGVSVSLAFSIALAFACGLNAFAQPSQARALPQITSAVDESKLVVLHGNTHPLANAQNDRGAVAAALPMQRMLLVLKRPVQQDKALAQAIAEMHRPGSKNFHQWFTPEQIGAAYGVADEDVNKVTAWLEGSGFNVTSVSKAHSVIEFSGTAQTVASAFHTEIHSYTWNGATYTANARDPQIPAALAPVVAGFAALNNFPPTAMHTPEKMVRFDKQAKTWTTLGDAAKTKQSKGLTPAFTITPGGASTNFYAVTPYDFATIYNVKPLWDAGIDGTGQHIAIVAESDINPADVDQFRSSFGLPGKKLNIIHNGPAAGYQPDESEAAIDAEWSGAVAKNATIDFVVSASTNTTAGIDLSALYIIDNQIAPVMSESYGYCELGLGVAGNLFYYQLWQQAAAQGITAILAAGDSGSSACDTGNPPPPAAQYGLAVSGFASTPYTLGVGGTDFEVSETNPTKYWNSTNDPATMASALSYIPEIPWNESCASPEVFAVYGSSYGDPTPEALCNDFSAPQRVVGGGGGASNCVTLNSTYDPNNPQPTACAAGYPKPDWQTGVNGIPNDNVRDLPDISLFASSGVFNSFYLFCESDDPNLPSPTCDFSDPNTVTYLAAGGTSFGAPAFAGIMSLVNQKTKSSQGLANYVLYSLGGQQYGSTASPNSSQTKACNASSDQTGANTCTFYDISVGSNAQPCNNGTANCITAVPTDLNGILTGYSSTTGYDPATGLGSVNAENLVNNWAAASVAKTTTSLTASPSTSTYGQPITLSGTVTATGSGTPAGSIVIQGMQQDQAVFTFANGAFSQSVSSFPAGSYNVQATYLGDSSFTSSLSSPIALTINKAATTGTLTFSSINTRSGVPIPSSNNQIPYGSSILGTLTVQGVSGVLAPTGNVAFTLDGNSDGTVPLTGKSASFQSVVGHLGNSTMSASYQGDSNYNASSVVTGTYTVVQAGTIVEVHANASTVPQGSPVTLIATINSQSYAAPPTGMVAFYVNGNSVGSAPVIPGGDPVTMAGIGTATLTVPASQLNAGTDEISATYSGDTNFIPSNATPSSFIYISGTQTSQVTLTASSTNATNTAPVTLSAAVTLNGAPASVGIVTFMDGAKILGKIPVVGLLPATGSTPGAAKLVTMLPLGTHSITASYGGVAGEIPAATSASTSIAVTGSQITTTFLSASNDTGTPANYDVTATLVAGGYTAPTGTVTLQQPNLNATLKSSALNPTAAQYELAPETELPIGGNVAATTTGDFNGDGIVDIAVTRETPVPALPNDPYSGMQLVIYLGKGDGTFQPGKGSVVSGDPNLQQPYGIVSGDFNADGIPDLAVGFRFGGNIVILLGNGDGTFHNGEAVSVPVPPGGYSTSIENLVLGDYNKDGIQDLAFANDNGLSVEVFFGNGDGSFSNSPAIIPDADGFANRLISGDVNNDGNEDLVAVRYYDNSLAVILGNGDGTFQNEVIYPTGNLPLGGALGDLNRDGFLDIVTPNQQDGTVSVLLNNGDGTFGDHTDYQVDYHFNDPTNYYPQPEDVEIGDLNGDRKLDVVIADAGTNQITVLNGNGDGTLNQFGPVLINTGTLPQQVVLADLNNDGVPDVITNEYVAASTGVLLNGFIETATIRNVALNGATTETEPLTATYAGDSANLPSTSAALTLPGSGTQLATKLDWSPSATSGVFGATLPSGVLNAQIENNIPGSIAYTAQLAGGAAVPVTPGASLPLSGAYTITAAFTPTNTNDYASSATSIAFTVVKAGTGATLTSSPSQAAQGASVTLTATVTSKTTGTPTGIVAFYSGANSLGSTALDATGAAGIAVNSLPVGTLSITASYLGDANFNTVTSAPVSVVINAPSNPGTPTISFTAAQSAVAISAGSTGTDALTVTPQSGFTGNVAFTCGPLPAGVACSFSPANGAVGASAFQSMLTVTTTGPSNSPSNSTSSRNQPGLLLVGGSAAGLASALFLVLPGRRKRILWLVVLLVAGMPVLFTGCGGSSSHTTTSTGSSGTTGASTSTVTLGSSSIKSAGVNPLTLSATVSGDNAGSATGSITFYDSGTQIGQANVKQGSAQITVSNLSVGTHAITAQYSGDSLNEAQTSNNIEQVITGQASFQVTATAGTVTQSTTLNITLQ